MKHLVHQIPIKFYHLDCQNQIAMPALINLLFEASGKHAEAYGFGIDTIREKYNISWIVGRIGIDFNTSLKRCKAVNIETWIDRTIGPSTLRKFRVRDEKGELLATCCFTYAALNLETRQAINVWELIGSEVSDMERGKDIRMPSKVRPMKGETQLLDTFPVKYSDLDYNQHATTAKYLQWITDAFDLTTRQQKRLQSIDVNFASELLYGDMVSTHLAKIDDSNVTVLLKSGDKTACLAKVVWGE